MSHLKRSLAALVSAVALMLALTYPSDTSGQAKAKAPAPKFRPIVYRDKMAKKVPPNFVIFGTHVLGRKVDVSITDSTGQIYTPADAASAMVPKFKVLKQPSTDTTQKHPNKQDWIVYCKVAENQNFTFTAKDRADGTPASITLRTGSKNDFRLDPRLIKEAKSGLLKIEGGTIIAPFALSPGTMSGTYCSTSFSPYGYYSAPDTQAESVTLQDPSNQNLIGTIFNYLDTDPNDQFWCVQFPDLTQPPYNYTGDKDFVYTATGDAGGGFNFTVTLTDNALVCQ
jgi:hypothetical protein